MQVRRDDVIGFCVLQFLLVFRHFRINQLVFQDVHVLYAEPVAVWVAGKEADGREEVERFCVTKVVETILQCRQQTMKSAQTKIRSMSSRCGVLGNLFVAESNFKITKEPLCGWGWGGVGACVRVCVCLCVCVCAGERVSQCGGGGGTETDRELVI